MNENIKELAIMCFDIQQDRRNLEEFSTDSYGIEKFANLIIHECIKKIEGTSPDLIQKGEYAQWWEGYDDRGADCIEVIKKHFGVE